MPSPTSQLWIDLAGFNPEEAAKNGRSEERLRSDSLSFHVIATFSPGCRCHAPSLQSVQTHRRLVKGNLLQSPGLVYTSIHDLLVFKKIRVKK